ncbi:hypothetical protein RMATCC62417_12121 [Rhizopus microsporus]|nr:hypothetical protein RMATCC62417_12121 [Rhizopus microsporus]
MNDPVLSSLCHEPVEYPIINCLSTEMIDSLQSVKHICLQVLDALLKQMADTYSPQRHRSSMSLLDSISQSTSLLSTFQMTRSHSSPANMCDIHKALESHALNSTQDYTLCCTLAAFLNDIYRLLELNDISNQEETSSDGQDTSLLQLQQQVTILQSKKKEGLNYDAATQEMLVIWQEMDRLMDIVCRLISQEEKKAPPAYEDTEQPPAYNMVHDSTLIESNKDDLDDLLNAIQQLSCVAPRLNNQRAHLTNKQVKRLAEETLFKSIERLQARRMDNQRASLKQKDMLQHLIQQIELSASRSFDNQRVQLTSQQQKFFDIHHIIHRMHKRRYTNQDAVSYEERLVNDLTRTTDLLVKSLHRPSYSKQRFQVRTSLFDMLRKQKEDKEKDLDQLFQFIHKSTKHQLNNQRASFTL